MSDGIKVRPNDQNTGSDSLDDFLIKKILVDSLDDFNNFICKFMLIDEKKKSYYIVNCDIVKSYLFGNKSR